MSENEQNNGTKSWMKAASEFSKNYGTRSATAMVEPQEIDVEVVAFDKLQGTSYGWTNWEMKLQNLNDGKIITVRIGARLSDEGDPLDASGGIDYSKRSYLRYMGEFLEAGGKGRVTVGPVFSKPWLHEVKRWGM